MTLYIWSAQTNNILRREGCVVLIDNPTPGDHWDGFYNQGWSPERMSAAFLDWSNGATTEDGKAVQRAIRQATGTT